MKALLFRSALALTLLLSGFAAGNVVAQQATLRFEKATLFSALKNVHARTGANIAFIYDGDTEQTFDIPVEARERMIGSVAAHYGKAPVGLQGAYVLRTTLSKPASEIQSDRDLAKTIDAWLRSEVGGREQLYQYSATVSGHIRDKMSGLEAGTFRFGDLTIEERQRVLDASRLMGYDFLLSNLRILAQ